jgi:hypothetical protein
MGWLLALAILMIIVAIGILIGGIYRAYEKDIHGKFQTFYFAIILIPLAAMVIVWIHGHEREYYIERGMPHTSYTQVRALSEHRITTSDDTNVSDATFTVQPEMIRDVKAGDILKVTYVNGVFRAYALKIEKLELKGE